MEYVTEELRIEGLDRLFPFRLCRKPTRLGDVDVDQWWMPHASVYGDRKHHAANRQAILDFYWTLCKRVGTADDPGPAESYALANLLPYARSNGARKVFVDSFPTRSKDLQADKPTVAAELDQLLRQSRARDERLDYVGFRDRTADAIGPPVYGPEVEERYSQFEADLLGQVRDGFRRLGTDGLDAVIDKWKGWMQSIGRRGGSKLDKQVLDILSYECRASMHRCYSAVWYPAMIRHLTRKYSLGEETAIFLQFWNLEHTTEANETDEAYFHLFHGHIFALHPACANFALTPTGRELLGAMLTDPNSDGPGQRLLHGLCVAVGHYAQRNNVYAELRKKQPEWLTGDMRSVEEQQIEKSSGRRLAKKRKDANAD